MAFLQSTDPWGPVRDASPDGRLGFTTRNQALDNQLREHDGTLRSIEGVTQEFQILKRDLRARPID